MDDELTHVKMLGNWPKSNSQFYTLIKISRSNATVESLRGYNDV